MTRDIQPPQIKFNNTIKTIPRVTQPDNILNVNSANITLQPANITLQPAEIPEIIYGQPNSNSLSDTLLDYVIVTDNYDSQPAVTLTSIPNANFPTKTIISHTVDVNRIGTWEVEYESKDSSDNLSTYKVYPQVRFRTFLEDLELCILETRNDNNGYMTWQKAKNLSDSLYQNRNTNNTLQNPKS